MSEAAGTEALKAFVNIALPLLSRFAGVPTLLANGVDSLAGFATSRFPDHLALIPLFILLLAKGLVYITTPLALYFGLYVLWSKLAHSTIHAFSRALSRDGDLVYFNACRVAQKIFNPLYLYFTAFALVGGWAHEYKSDRPLSLSGALEGMCYCAVLLFVAVCFVAVCVPIIRVSPLERMLPAYFPAAETGIQGPGDQPKDTDSDEEGTSGDHDDVCFNCKVEARVSESVEEVITDMGDLVLEACSARVQRNTVLTMGDVRRAVSAAVEQVTDIYV